MSVVIGIVLCAAACSDSSAPPTTPTTPSTPAPTPPPAPTTYVVSGALTATNDGRPLTGMNITIGGSSTTTDGAGRYTLTLPISAGSVPYSVSGGNLLTHSGYITAGSTRTANFDAIAQDPTFDLSFYRQLVRDQFSSSVLRTLLRWTTNPNIYVRTVDSTTGRVVEPEVLALVVDWAQRSVPLWTAGRLRVARLETGAADRPDTPDWIVVDFIRDSTKNYCGQSFVGRNPGRVTLNNDRCNCGSTKVPAGTVLHEFGHALGFFHVSDRQSIMYPQDPGGCPAPALSVAEQRHSAIAYSRPNGNADPDSDSPASVFVVPTFRIP